MNNEIYYFSGTGNALAVAREIAKRTDAKLIPIPSVINADEIYVATQMMGIVFPSYLAVTSGVPLIIERFVKKIANIKTIHVFTVCTCGAYESVNALPSLRTLNRIIRSCGGQVSAEYSVRLPMNNLDYDHIPIPIEKDSGIIICRSKNRIDDICNCILKKRGTKYKGAKVLFLFLMTPLFRLMQKPVINGLKEKAKVPGDSKLEYSELIPLTDKSIVVDEKCIGCGTCANVCPVQNIKIVDKKPLFQHRCEMCFACDEWCPHSAIRHWSRRKGVKYHHPDVRLSDMLLNNRR
jgi:ferredoxin/flavodoxin